MPKVRPDVQEDAEPQRNLQTCLPRLVDFDSFTTSQVVLFAPNLIMLAAYAFCHLFRFESAHLLHPTVFAATSNFDITALFGVYSWGLMWPLLAGILHAGTAVRFSSSKDAPKVSSKAKGEDTAKLAKDPSEDLLIEAPPDHTNIKEYDVAVRDATAIGPEWVQILIWSACHVLIAPRVTWVIVAAIAVSLGLLQLCRFVCIGTVRREFYSSAGVPHYVSRFVLRWFACLIFVMFTFSYSLVMSFSYPAIVAGAFGGESAEFDFSVLPDITFCAQYVNQTYLDAYCTGVHPSVAWWQPTLHQESCNDGGWAGLYRSLFDACEARVVYDGIFEVGRFALIASVSAYAAIVAPEIMLSIEPNIASASLSTIIKVAGSWTLRGAILFFGLAVMCIPLEVARMLSAQPGTSSDPRTGSTFGSVLSGRQIGSFWVIWLAMPDCFLAILLIIEFLRRKVSPARFDSHFLSYKTQDGNDRAVIMLYHTLPGNNWLDIYNKNRAVDDMARGVLATDVFIAFLSPKYFKSAYCCLEMYVAIRAGKPIVCAYNSAEYKFNDAERWVPDELGNELKLSDFIDVPQTVEFIKPCVEKIQSSKKKPFNAPLPVELKNGSQSDFEEMRQAWSKAVELYASLKPKDFYANLKSQAHEQAAAASQMHEVESLRASNDNTGGNAVAINISSDVEAVTGANAES